MSGRGARHLIKSDRWFSPGTLVSGVKFKQKFQLASRTSRYKNQLAPQISTSPTIMGTITKTCFSFLYVSQMSTPFISSSSHTHIKSVIGRLFFIKAWTLRNRFVIPLNTFLFNDCTIFVISLRLQSLQLQSLRSYFLLPIVYQLTIDATLKFHGKSQIPA